LLTPIFQQSLLAVGVHLSTRGNHFTPNVDCQLDKCLKDGKQLGQLLRIGRLAQNDN
jgi:hypothetical protein